MKTTILKSSVLATIMAISFSFAGTKLSTLPEITKPYLGCYQCKSVTLGDKEYLDDFSDISLYLNNDETFTLYYSPKDGERHEQKGNYKYDIEKGTITFSIKGLPCFKRSVVVEKGVFFITLPIGIKTLRLHFEQK